MGQADLALQVTKIKMEMRNMIFETIMVDDTTFGDLEQTLERLKDEGKITEDSQVLIMDSSLLIEVYD